MTERIKAAHWWWKQAHLPESCVVLKQKRRKCSRTSAFLTQFLQTWAYIHTKSYNSIRTESGEKMIPHKGWETAPQALLQNEQMSVPLILQVPRPHSMFCRSTRRETSETSSTWHINYNEFPKFLASSYRRFSWGSVSDRVWFPARYKMPLQVRKYAIFAWAKMNWHEPNDIGRVFSTQTHTSRAFRMS
jgi:hypothetical protein